MPKTGHEAGIPDKALFDRWRNGDSEARERIFSALWKWLFSVGFHYCSSLFPYYPERHQFVCDVIHDVLVETWRRVEANVRSGNFEWQGTGQFYAYCKTVFLRELSKVVKKLRGQLWGQRAERKDADEMAHDDSSLESRGEIVAGLLQLVYDFSVAAERLRMRGKLKEAEIAEVIVLYLKCHAACQTPEFAGRKLSELPVDKIVDSKMEELIDSISTEGLREVGFDADSAEFRDFLMRYLCNLQLDSVERATYCEILGVSFTQNKAGTRRRITQKQLVEAHKMKRRQRPDDARIDEAYRVLSEFLRKRAYVDQRWRRFKKAYDSLADE